MIQGANQCAQILKVIFTNSTISTSSCQNYVSDTNSYFFFNNARITSLYHYIVITLCSFGYRRSNRRGCRCDSTCPGDCGDHCTLDNDQDEK